MSSTITTLTKVIQSEVLAPAVLAHAKANSPSSQFVYWKSLIGLGSGTGRFLRDQAGSASAKTENAELAASVYTPTSVDVSPGVSGIRRDISDEAMEDAALDLFAMISENSGIALGLHIESLIVALHSGFSNSVGTSGAAVTNANLISALGQIDDNGMSGEKVFVLSSTQKTNLIAAHAASTATTAHSFLQLEEGPNGLFGKFLGAEMYSTSLCPLANADADRVGACYIRGDKSPQSAAIGGVISRLPKIEVQRDAEKTLSKVVATQRVGVGEICDDSGVGIVTDA